MARGSCSQCCKPTEGSGEYKPDTCGASECQQGATCDNFHKNAAVRRARVIACPAGKGCKVKPGTSTKLEITTTPEGAEKLRALFGKKLAGFTILSVEPGDKR